VHQLLARLGYPAAACAVDSPTAGSHPTAAQVRIERRMMAPRCGRIVDVASSNWLDRYREGQRGLVWHELRQLGSTVRESDLFEEAQLVCDEMARRARQNVEVIVERPLE